MAMLTDVKRTELRRSLVDLTDRGLTAAAKWAGEQLAGLPEPDGKHPPARSARQSRAGSSGAASHHADGDDDAYHFAKSLFDMKEYRRAAHVLKGASGPRAVFLRGYSTYLAGEKRKEEERIESAGLLGKEGAANKELELLESELQAATRDPQTADPFLLYLYGLVLSDRERRAEAREALLRSVHGYPCNWSAWQALAAAAAPGQELAPDADASMPRHWTREFHLVHICLETQENDEALGRLQSLAAQFPGSEWVTNATATAQYNLRNFDEAQELFEDLLERDPHRIEGMDVYSNILYVKEAFAALSHLAHRVSMADKYRPESCCIVGNYYSLKGQHEKAVQYFRRALKLNRNYLSAWTLMGHEYVEMKNPPAAIEAYRRAVDLNPRDYRAWYGLGQTYELLHMPFYALNYFRRATQLRPHDARMWIAMGQCYEHEQLSMAPAAIRCYHRAHDSGDREGIALHKLARCYERGKDLDAAARCYEANLARIDAEQLQGQDAPDALLFLATYKKNAGELAAAEGLCLRLLDFGAASKERAKALLREIRSMQVAGSASAMALAAASLADDDDMAQWDPAEDMAMTPGSMGGAPHEGSLTLDTAFDISPQY
ncbi:TPR-like protein [Coccomyxa subellipsoidea C-169]|uniref:TPR-like protein n=1 Tax=Coccomyxa subellipsoidea (strain C-169) TaxID=574566 RepID=I0YW25_COCSC|nr:TPR-like protein [Coccomyxa subellipsoidea C-169]EIE22594.1 TPR-like protein [Coccomyxa subellipsoidea C-169]|eukprot:XP_005647138.1 TPR-like protein [Coccomyxa subellipsoidea C-169]